MIAARRGEAFEVNNKALMEKITFGGVFFVVFGSQRM
jgi:hypothetical protein